MGKVIKSKWDKGTADGDPSSGKVANKDKIFQLHISIEEIEPAVWRRLLVPGNITLRKLHRIIQEAMGWTDTHLHEFTIGNAAYSDTSPELDPPADLRNEKRMHLYRATPPAGGSFLYVYDFGDDWVHRVVVEKILDSHERFSGKPVCLEGERACPPEDCGGPFGYHGMLDIIGNERHPEYEDTMEWLGSEFDPNWFDIEETNLVLALVR